MNDELIEWLRAEQEAGWSTDLANLFRKSADEIERLRAELAAAKTDAEYAWKNTRTIELDRQKAWDELAAVRSGDPCGRMCEGNAYRIEARRLADELDALKVKLSETEWVMKAQAKMREAPKAAQSEPIGCVHTVQPCEGTAVVSLRHETNGYVLPRVGTNLYAHPKPADAEIERLRAELADWKQKAVHWNGMYMREGEHTSELRAELAALKAAQSEPVAWTTKGQIASMENGMNHYIQGRVPRFVQPTENDVPLYLHPQPADAETLRAVAKEMLAHIKPLCLDKWEEWSAAIDAAIKGSA